VPSRCVPSHRHEDRSTLAARVDEEVRAPVAPTLWRGHRRPGGRDGGRRGLALWRRGIRLGAHAGASTKKSEGEKRRRAKLHGRLKALAVNRPLRLRALASAIFPDEGSDSDLAAGA